MFLGKINADNNKVLLTALESIKHDGIDGLIEYLYLKDKKKYRLLRTKSDSSFIMLDLFFYRMAGVPPIDDEPNALKVLVH